MRLAPSLATSLLAVAAALSISGCTLFQPVEPDAPVVQPAAPAAPAPAAPAAAATANTLAVSRVIDLGQGVTMLMGQGGNMALLNGSDGLFVIDDQYATNAEANLAKIEEIAKAKPKFLVNTHWHSDHAGGNEVFAKEGATIFASENARRRLTGQVKSVARDGQVTPASPKTAWPVVTFVEGIDFHLNGQTIRVFKSPLPTHTDGDMLIYFVEADVIHMGDTYMKDRYPFVDTGSGGTQAGFIATLNRALEIIGPNTKVIPGHGDLANRKDIEAALSMHEGARAAVEGLVKGGATLQQAIAAKPLQQWNARFGGPGAFITDDAYVTVIYNELKK
ncbi:MAG TPA: MBL fold metallo-hydrolase [Hyphomonadaceae bacterium]|nr:MBL fold metallo-hydrolase [Hyphomonadaceae bacterium]